MVKSILVKNVSLLGQLFVIIRINWIAESPAMHAYVKSRQEVNRW